MDTTEIIVPYGEEGAGVLAQNPTERKTKPSSGEFLSGFHKTDRLIPVVTLVIYRGRTDGMAHYR